MFYPAGTTNRHGICNITLPAPDLPPGSLVPVRRTLESGWLYLGRPAKAARRLSAEEIAYFAYTAGNYVKLAAEYRGA